MEKIRLNAAEHGDLLVDLIRSGGYIPLCVTGTSMQPLLHSEQDIVWLKACTPDMLRRGRILLFRRADGAFILHRIRKCLPDGRLLMNGDAQDWCEIISAECAIAVAEELTLCGKRMPYHHFGLWLFDALWYPTRPLRPLFFRLRAAFLKSCLKKD